MGKRNILEEALSESKTLREAALNNAKIALMENIKDVVKESVDKQLNEAAEEEHSEPDGDECAPDDSGNVTEGMEGLDLDMDIDEEGGDEGEEDMTTDLDDGLNGDDLSEAIAEALETLGEVENPSMGDIEMVGDGHHADGFNGDKESAEKEWEDETAPAAKNQHQLQGVKSESKNMKALQKKVTELVKENILLKKANKNLRSTVEDIKLFNTKITFANKLLAKEGLSNSTKRKIVEKMDMAKTISEAKSIYEAFHCALGALSESEKPKAKKAPALTEVLGSTGANVPMNKETLKEQVYGNTYSVKRFQRLAGLKNSED